MRNLANTEHAHLNVARDAFTFVWLLESVFRSHSIEPICVLLVKTSDSGLTGCSFVLLHVVRDYLVLCSSLLQQ